MTKDMLQQYMSLQAEIKELEEEIERNKIVVSDTVSGSSDVWPYTQHSVMVKGLPGEVYTLNAILSKRSKRLQEQRKEIERFLDSIEDSQIRRIIKLKYIEGKTWQQVANRLGYQDEGSPRKKIDSLFKDSENSEISGVQ